MTTAEQVPSTDPATVSAGAPESNILRSLLSSTSNIATPSSSATTAERVPSTASAPESSILRSLLSSTSYIATPSSSATTAERVPSTDPSTLSVHGMAASEPESSIARRVLPPTSNIATPSSSATTAERVPSADPSRVSVHGMAASEPQSSTVRNLLSSTSDIASPPSSGTTVEGLPQGWRLSAQAESATENLEASFKWVKEVLGGVSDEVLLTHPFYRNPGVQLRFSKRTFNQDAVEWFRTRKQTSLLLLLKCRYLMKKPSLTTREVESLLTCTERLCGYATTVMPNDYTVQSAIATWGKVFIVLDALHCAAEVLGRSSRRDVWWPRVVRHLRDARYFDGPSAQIVEKTSWGSCILNGLSAALDYYRLGHRPPPRLVVSLKLALFLLPVQTDFRKKKWDPWREDAAEWLESAKPSRQQSKQ
ncbi:uncharacterized protein EMH_0052720 [Eimeria mitis]|uniref:Uncharacterized protein n=1 Tax=Eimeria mitis TaxID=44415 RepID=U6K0F6_9EIME|nr:uncharacterized protein EMH_0052720 [Eimeria mitis]CDJ29792.1 hypothetical protein, conserved [Eimeria mitis]